MPMEKISKYTKFFDLLVIGDEESSSIVCKVGLDYFRTMRRIDFAEITSEALSCHILIVNGSLANMSSPSARTLNGQIQRLETLVLSDNLNIAVYKEALGYRAGYVGQCIASEQEFATMMLSTLPNIIKKHNESLVVLNYKQVVDNTAHMYWIYRGSKGTFANEAFKKFYGLSALNAFDTSDSAHFLKQVTTPEIG